jgi:hypothetical protein
LRARERPRTLRAEPVDPNRQTQKSERFQCCKKNILRTENK